MSSKRSAGMVSGGRLRRRDSTPKKQGSLSNIGKRSVVFTRFQVDNYGKSSSGDAIEWVGMLIGINMVGRAEVMVIKTLQT